MTDYVPTFHRGFETIEIKQNTVRIVLRKKMQDAEKE